MTEDDIGSLLRQQLELAATRSWSDEDRAERLRLKTALETNDVEHKRLSAEAAKLYLADDKRWRKYLPALETLVEERTELERGLEELRDRYRANGALR